jgi:hypothetical protein
MRNGKLMLACAEAVEDETSLWKEKEKAEKIPGHGFTRIDPKSLYHQKKGTTEAVPLIRVDR